MAQGHSAREAGSLAQCVSSGSQGGRDPHSGHSSPYGLRLTPADPTLWQGPNPHAYCAGSLLATSHVAILSHT